MMRSILLIILLYFCGGNAQVTHNFTTVEITDTYKNDSLSIRGLEIIDEDSLVLAYNSGYGILTKGEDGFNDDNLFFNEPVITNDSTYSNLAFRSVAVTKNRFFALSIANPAVLLSSKLNAENANSAVVYKEINERVFYDSMTFFDDTHGIAIGDPTGECLSIILTEDGGKTWKKVSCNSIPKVIDGEAAFAASDTNIKVLDNEAWIISGGKASRVYHSKDRGQTWQVFETPLTQGKATTGGYSIDFYNSEIGFIVGGDYTEPENGSKNKAITVDGGKNWTLVSDGAGIGYKSCVQFVPNSGGKELVAVGFTGISYSKDSGQTWQTLSKEGFYSIRFLNDSVAYVSGNGRVCKLKFLK